MSDIKTSPSEENTLLSKGYKLLKFVGEGAYAKVYLAEYTTKEGVKCNQQLACKVIETAKAPRDFVVKFLPREIDVLIRLSHPHLIHVHSIFQRKSKYYIFMRFTECGDLLSFILKNGCVSENQSRVWVRQLALAVQYLHELDIAHRDIKCENILLTANNNVKLSDFGFARFCVDDEDQPILSETYCGSMSYAAPEILRGKPYAPKPTDLWSLGVVLFVMLNKSMPFDDTRMRKLYEQQMSKKYRFRSRVANAISLECKSLVKNLLEPDPGLRFSSAAVVTSDWIAMDSRLGSLNQVEALALKRAREERRKLAESRKNPIKRQGDILDSTTRTDTTRGILLRIYKSIEYIVLSHRNDSFLNPENAYSSVSAVFIPPEHRMPTLCALFRRVRRKRQNPMNLTEIRSEQSTSSKKVYLSEYKNAQKNGKVSTLACKVIDTDYVPKDFAKKFLPREIDLLTRLSHPHLVHTHSIFQRRSKYFIFLRHMENGDLLDFILSRGAVHEDQARIWTRQIALAIQYMHEMEIAHRDVKCENVLLTTNYNAKLTDFGFARNCLDRDGAYLRSETFCGSLSYTAPEILQGSPYFPKPADIWSLGVVLYVMLNRAMPFEDKHVKGLLQSQMNNSWRFRSKYFYKISDQCKTLIKGMLNPNFQTRIKIQDIVDSDWIAMDARLTEWTPQEQAALQKARSERLNYFNKKPVSAKSGSKSEPTPLVENLTATTPTPGPFTSEDPASVPPPPGPRPSSGQHSTLRSHSSAHRSFTRQLSSARKSLNSSTGHKAPPLKPTETVANATVANAAVANATPSTLKDTEFITKTDDIIEYSSADDA